MEAKIGKRESLQQFEKRPRDLFETIDPAAVLPLAPFVEGLRYAEPCCGSGQLINLLQGTADCVWASDVVTDRPGARIRDASTLTEEDLLYCDIICSNPPFSWALLKPLLDHLPTLKPTWLLLPADVAYNVRMAPYMRRCQTIVAIGRLFWLPNKVKGVDNYAFYLFDYNSYTDSTVFIGRT